MKGRVSSSVEQPCDRETVHSAAAFDGLRRGNPEAPTSRSPPQPSARARNTVGVFVAGALYDSVQHSPASL